MPVTHPAIQTRLNEQWQDVHHANAEVRVTRLRSRAQSQHHRRAALGSGRRPCGPCCKHAFDSDQPLRVPGGRWSLSTIGKPKSMLLDLSNYRAYR